MATQIREWGSRAIQSGEEADVVNKKVEMAIKNFSPERIKLEMKQALKSYPFWVLTPN